MVEAPRGNQGQAGKKRPPNRDGTAQETRQAQMPLAGLGSVPQGAESLSGTVARIIYENRMNDWKVVAVEDASGRELVATGRLPGVREGESVTLWGRWTTTKKYGRRFEVDGFAVVSPATERGILKLLSSGFIEGIGKGLAKRLVDEFGSQTLEIIRNDPDRLRSIEGIGPKRSRRIKEALEKHEGLREALVFLQGHGLGIAQSQKVYKIFGARTIAAVQTDPYRLVTDVRGIGFLTADRIAQSMGIAPDAPTRIQAGLVHELQTAADDGHCFLPEPELLSRAAERLSLDEPLVVDQVEALISRHLVVAQSSAELGKPEAPRVIYPVGLFHAETGVAADAARLIRSEGSSMPDAASALRRVEHKLGLTLGESQVEAVTKALAHKVVLITGGPGTGKTTLVRTLTMLFEQADLSVELAAPTGRAARRLAEVTGRPARTIHRLLEYAPQARGFLRNRQRPLDLDVLVLDEVSMVDIVLAFHVLSALPDRARLILVGDSDQLPSVGPGSVLADFIASGRVPTSRLTQVFRQAAMSKIVTAAHQVNQGRMIDLTEGKGTSEGEFFHLDTDDPAKITDLILRMVTERIPRRYGMDPVRDVQVLSPMKRGPLGIDALNDRLRDVLNPANGAEPSDAPFRPGDKVMQIRNDYDKDVFNGDIGIVTSVHADSLETVVDFDGRKVPFEASDLNELVLAYACTVHKSQGSEYPAVIMPLVTGHYMMLQRNLLYTAITRARKLFVLLGPSRALRIAVSNDRIRHRYTGLAPRIHRLLT